LKDQVSQAYEKTDNIIIVDRLISIFLESKQSLDRMVDGILEVECALDFIMNAI
jgi:hypothetical protein